VDLPVGTGEAQISCGFTECKGRGGDLGESDPGALVLNSHTSGWEYDGSSGNSRGQLNIKSCFATAHELGLWATDLGELLSLVVTIWDELLGVQENGSASFDFLVESVGAPPAGVGSSGVIDLRGTECYSTSRSSVCALSGDASGLDHCESTSSLTICARVIGMSNQC
jgi:hypothetical protein